MEQQFRCEYSYAGQWTNEGNITIDKKGYRWDYTLDVELGYRWGYKLDVYLVGLDNKSKKIIIFMNRFKLNVYTVGPNNGLNKVL